MSFVGLMKTSNFTFGKLTVAKSEFSNFFQIKNVIFLNISIFILANVCLGVGTLCSSLGAFPGKKGEIQVLTGLAPSNQTVGSLLRIPRAPKPTEDNVV
jgi:hypothetical protein